MLIRNLQDLNELKQQGLSSLFPARTRIAVGMATCGRASGADEVFDAIRDEVDKRKLDVEVTSSGCLGFCQKEPIIDVIKPGWPRIIYAEIDAAKAREVVAALADNRIIPKYALCRCSQQSNLIEDSVKEYQLGAQPADMGGIPCYEQVPFFGKQDKRVLHNCGLINPDKIEEYVAQGGYLALLKALTDFGPEDIIEQVTRSGLRGRGGAGFPTGRKWALCRRSQGEPKYVICNADEGDPGAYMDRSILEGNPHSVIEGMAIGAYAMGARYGYIYVRAEYPLAITKLQVALKQAEEYGLLGKNILGSGFDFSIAIECGSGAFVCGEETALIASIMGLTGEPRQRPPFPAESGVWGKPTNINNVKTWANVPLIVARGADWFSAVGTEDSKGTVIFSLVGKVKNTGLVEVPMGTKLSSLVFDIGGGIPFERKLKAVQTGGPSGGCIPASLAHVTADYETLAQYGAIMGSGGLVVMDENTCMVDVAKYFLNFTRDESCGKCTPCREGTKRMLEILTDITEGRGREQDLEMLEEMAAAISDSSLCGLGGTAPNPVLTTLKYFRDEYEQHIKYKRCPAMVCHEIIFTPCKFSCPLKTDVPAFVAHIARGEYRDAFEVIRGPNPFPISCGFICHHPCEDRCRSLETGDESISIKALKRFVGENAMKNGLKPVPKPKVPELEKVAIIGAGPAGLTAAFDLAQLGYQPTVFEAAAVPGGNLTAVIPEFRLPKLVVDLEVDCIKQMGVKILTNTRIGSDITLNDLLSQGFKAIVLATGAHRSLKADFTGEDGPGVLNAFSFLEDVKQGKKVTLGLKVGVIGGGNSAIDAARTALRAGAAEVFIIYRRTRVEMPAMKREFEAGLEEGIRIVELAAPVRTICADGRLTGIECLAMRLGDPDESGRRRPVPQPGSEFTLPLDNVILAIGEEPDLSYLPEGHGIEISRWNTIMADPETLATARAGVFAAGDLVTGPSSIADSIAGGKLAAVSVHKFLRGQPLAGEYAVTPPSPYVKPVERAEEDLELKRVTMPCAPAPERIRNFGVVELGYSERAAQKEARRCLRCDLTARSSASTGGPDRD